MPLKICKKHAQRLYHVVYVMSPMMLTQNAVLQYMYFSVKILGIGKYVTGWRTICVCRAKTEEFLSIYKLCQGLVISSLCPINHVATMIARFSFSFVCCCLTPYRFADSRMQFEASTSSRSQTVNYVALLHKAPLQCSREQTASNKHTMWPSREKIFYSQCNATVVI